MPEILFMGPGGASAANQETEITRLTEIRDQPADVNEDASVLYEPIDFNGAGAHIIVPVTVGFRLRLRRFLLTSGDPDAEPPSNPVLTLTLGGKTLRSTLLAGRFDILGDDGEDLVITASKAGQVDGTVGYTLEIA